MTCVGPAFHRKNYVAAWFYPWSAHHQGSLRKGALVGHRDYVASLISTVSPYDEVNEWWGEPLSTDLIDRMAISPENHLKQFARYCWERRPTGDLPELPRGALRPLLIHHSHVDDYNSSTLLDSAVATLLYAQEVAV